MLTGVTPSLIQGLTAVGLLILILISFLWALKKGLIFIKPQFDEIVRLQEARVADSKERESQWRDVADKWQTTAQVAIANNEADLEQGRTIIALLESVKAAQRSPRR